MLASYKYVPSWSKRLHLVATLSSTIALLIGGCIIVLRQNTRRNNNLLQFLFVAIGVGIAIADFQFMKLIVGLLPVSDNPSIEVAFLSAIACIVGMSLGKVGVLTFSR
jgi:hypothetical protein